MKKFKVLIIRFRRVGDAVLTSSLCTTLRQSIPDVEIHYVLDEHIGQLFENHPDIDRVIKFSKKEKNSSFIYLTKIWKLMRKERYDAIIDARSTFNTLFFSLFSLNSKYRIGLGKKYNRLIHNYTITESHASNYIENIHLLAAPLNKEFDITANREFHLYCTETEKSQFKHKMRQAGINFEKPIICCAVATRVVSKRWPLDRMKAVLQFLINKYDAQLIFNFNGEEETSYALKLYEEMGKDANIFINIEAGTIRELAAMISNCDFFFGNEGGPRHISQALNIPSFAIFPPGIPIQTWLPNKSDIFDGIEPDDINKTIAHDHNIPYEERFGLITVEEVTKRLEKSLMNRFNLTVPMLDSTHLTT